MKSQKLCQESNIQEHKPTLKSLPCEIALDILSRLPITSIINASWVCKYWHNLTQNPLLANMHFSRISNNNDPSLLFLYNSTNQNQLYSLYLSTSDPNIDNKSPIRIPVPLLIPKLVITGSCNGLLYSQDSLNPDSSFIHNPFTRKYIELPEPEKILNQHRVAVGFGFDSVSKKYKVVRVVYYRTNNGEANFPPGRYSLPKSEVQVLTLGSGNLFWRSKGKTSYQLLGKPSQASINGRLHWLSCRGRYLPFRMIVWFDLEHEQFGEVSYPNQESLRFCNYCSHIVNLKGCLAVVIQGFRSIYVWVMKEYGVKESWVKEFSIGDHMLRQLEPHTSNVFVYIPKFCLAQAQVLCLLKNGEVLIKLICKTLVCYNPISGEFKEIIVQGLPEWCDTLLHVGTLNWIDTHIMSL